MRISFAMTAAVVALTVCGVAAPAPAVDAGSAAIRLARQHLVTQQQGVWTGLFRRYDAQGSLIETIPSEIHIRFPAGQPHDYHQTNILRPAGGKEQRIETFGKWDGGRLRFSSARIDGTYGALDFDPDGLNTALLMRFKDGSGLTVAEIITVSPDGKRRMRAAQYVVGGRIVRRTLIDEERQAEEP